MVKFGKFPIFSFTFLIFGWFMKTNYLLHFQKFFPKARFERLHYNENEKIREAAVYLMKKKLTIILFRSYSFSSFRLLTVNNYNKNTAQNTEYKLYK